jgi:hypothetical protein
MRGDRARRWLPLLGFAGALLFACDYRAPEAVPASLVAASQPAPRLAPTTRPAMESSVSLPGYDLRWTSVNTIAQFELQRGVPTYSITLLGKLAFPADHLILATSQAEVIEALSGGEDLLAGRTVYSLADRLRLNDPAPGTPGASPLAHALGNQPVQCAMSGLARRPARLDKLTGQVRVLVARERLTRDLELGDTPGFLEVNSQLSVKLTQSSSTSAPGDAVFTLRYRKPGSAAEAYQSNLETLRPPIVLDFTLLDAHGRELEIRGTTAHVGTAAVNMGRMEGTIQGTFTLLPGQTAETLRVLYIPATQEKILTFTARNVPVP